jgi:probable F420-dependent oxidoreductase
VQFVFNMPFWSCPPNPEFVSQRAIMEMSATAEEAGFSGVAFTEHPIPTEAWRQDHGHDALDPFVGLAYAGAATQRLKLLTYIVVLPYRNPFLLAKSAATLDALSGGRLILGLGAGYQEAEFAALGVDFAERSALFEEGLDVLKLAWSGEPVDYKGRHFTASGVTAQPTPAQKPHVPLWIGGNSKVALRRIAEKAQGWLAMPSTPLQAERRRSVAMDMGGFEEKLTLLRELGAAAGRKEPIDVHFPLAQGVEAAAVSENRETLRQISALDVGWAGWGADARTLSAMKDEIRRFGDEVIARHR